MKVSLNATLTSVDSFRVVQVWDTYMSCVVTNDLSGRSIPRTSGGTGSGYFTFELIGPQTCSNLTLSWIERCPGSTCNTTIKQYTCISNSRIYISLY